MDHKPLNLNINYSYSRTSNRVITDGEIMRCVGVVTYSHIQRMFPHMFRPFHETDYLVRPSEAHIPAVFWSWADLEAFTFKRRLVEAMLHPRSDDPYTQLLGSSQAPRYPLLQSQSYPTAWIFICFVLITILTISFIALFKKH